MITDTPKYFDSQGKRIEGITVTGKVHPRVLKGIAQKAGTTFGDYPTIHRFVEELIDEKLN